LQSTDPPFSQLISISSEISNNADIVGTSLQLKWSYPKMDSDDEHPDKVGDGGDQVTSFLIEWSKESPRPYGTLKLGMIPHLIGHIMKDHFVFVLIYRI